jgi:hypothetical protein
VVEHQTIIVTEAWRLLTLHLTRKADVFISVPPRNLNVDSHIGKNVSISNQAGWNYWLRAWGGATFNDKTTNLLDAMLSSIHKSSRQSTDTRYTVPPDLKRDLDNLGYAVTLPYTINKR